VDLRQHDRHRSGAGRDLLAQALPAQRALAMDKQDPGKSNHRQPRSVADVTRENVRAMRRLDELAVAQRTLADRIAEFVARFCGSITFVWIHSALFTAWILWNVVPGLRHFDPYPFIFLTLCVSLEAIFLSSFILISQNYEMRVSDRRNQLDLQINLLAEQENTKMLQLLDRIARKVGASEEEDPEVKVLEQATRPETLARQIEKELRAHSGQDKGRK
jgi:uncharacterized membrane protein